MSNVFWRVSAFVVLIVAGFVVIGQNVPQIASYPPKEFSEEEFQKLAKAQLIEKGKEVFGTGGQRCSQCHIIGSGMPGRGPNLAGIGRQAAERARERSAQTGKPTTAEEYILESLVDPRAYLVKDYPPIMPPVYQAPLELSETEIKAVAAYLLNQGGEMTITGQTALKPEYSQKIRAARLAAAAPPKGSAQNGADLFYNRMRCVGCHKVNGVGGEFGPDLSGIGGVQTADYLREAIVDPDAVIVTGFKKGMMEPHFKQNLTGQELDDLVRFLSTLKGEMQVVGQPK